MKQIGNTLITLITMVAQVIGAYLLGFIAFISTSELFGLGKSATVPDPLWVEIVVYALSAAAIAFGMWAVGLGIAKLRKHAAPGWPHFWGAFVGGGLSWAWLMSTPMGQTRNPLIVVVAVLLGFYLPDLIKMFSGNKE